MGWLRLDELARTLKINETAWISVESSDCGGVLYYEGTIRRLDEDTVYVALEEKTGWGSDFEGEESIQELDWLWVLEYQILH